MSHQITGLITRTSVLLPLDSGLGLPFQQVLGNAQPEESCLQLSAAAAAPLQPLQPRAAGRDAQPAPPQRPYCPVLQAVPWVLRRLSLSILEETSSRRTVPQRLIYPSSILPFLHQAPRTCLSQDPQLQAAAELPLLAGQTEGPLPWSYIPMEPQRPSPGRAAFIAANKQKHHVLIASLKAPSSFCSWGCKFFKLIWAESMIQRENSLFTQSPAVTPRLTVQGERLWPCSDGESSLLGLKTCQAANPSPTRGSVHWESFSVNSC